MLNLVFLSHLKWGDRYGERMPFSDWIQIKAEWVLTLTSASEDKEESKRSVCSHLLNAVWSTSWCAFLGPTFSELESKDWDGVWASSFITSTWSPCRWSLGNTKRHTGCSFMISSRTALCVIEARASSPEYTVCVQRERSIIPLPQGRSPRFYLLFIYRKLEAIQRWAVDYKIVWLIGVGYPQLNHTPCEFWQTVEWSFGQRQRQGDSQMGQLTDKALISIRFDVSLGFDRSVPKCQLLCISTSRAGRRTCLSLGVLSSRTGVITPTTVIGLTSASKCLSLGLARSNVHKY